MSNQQRARLPRTPSTSSTSQRNIDVQNNTISATGENFTNQNFTNNNINISDDALNILGPDLAVQTNQVLENLTDQERSMILDVLSRDESIRQRDAARLMFLQTELNNFKKRAIKSCGSSLDRTIILDVNRSCARCRIDLGRILNRGTVCRACKLRVCKGCREFTNRTDWLCIVCHKQIELQNASGEWIAEVARTPPRRSSISQPGFIPTAEIIRKSISRSWTISNPEEDQLPSDKNGVDKRIVHSNLHAHDQPSSYPNLIRLNKSPYSSNMDFSNSENYERTPPTPRRILRQSTLPNPSEATFSSHNSLKIPSPNQQAASPQYSPYHTDNENDPEPSEIIPPQRYQIRRQSTLPCKPNESQKFLSTSPNRPYSRSPDPSSIMDSEHSGMRYPPFVRQATFPSNNGVPPQQQPMEHHQRQLPTSPNRLSVNKSPDNGSEPLVSPRRFMRQTTLPNPDQHMKLLPTSPPKKSPQYIKRSPEFQRQITISNPEGMSTLSVHGPKFLPISPRQKQNFLFPQPAPRAFLSQQHFPTANEDQPHTVHPQHPQSKMIKVRSHSNEEYSFNKALLPPGGGNQEGSRRLLPEIPNRARSPSRLVRQDHVKDEGEKRSPIYKTFADANQAEGYDEPQIYESQYTNEYSELNSTFAEADENNYLENTYLEATSEYDSNAASALLTYAAEQTTQFQGIERYDYNPPADYYSPEDYIKQAQKNRNRRRMSRELPDPEVIISSSTDDELRKPKAEAMRSISEDVNPKTIKILPRRSFSQPEKDSLKKTPEGSQLPSPKLLATPPKEEKCDVTDDAQSKVPKKPTYKFPKMLEMRGDSRSFDAVVRHLIKSENKDGDDKSQSMDDNLFQDKKEHKTTLNEAEIQSAVEQAAGLFKKVVLQRRKEKKPAEDGEMAGRQQCEDYTSYSTDIDDYRLVFLSSSDSYSSEEKDDDDTSSKCSVILDECDWDDYFEPGVPTAAAAASAITTTNSRKLLKDFSPFQSPFFDRKTFLSSPHTYQREMSESPASLPRLMRESDTGTDEEILAIESSSQTSSEGFLSAAWEKNHKCATVKSKSHSCKCSSTPQYVAIPVPILIPMESLENWNKVNHNNPDLLQLLNNSNLLQQYQHQNITDVINTSSSSSHLPQNQQVRKQQSTQQQSKHRVELNDDENCEKERAEKVLPEDQGDRNDNEDGEKEANRERKRGEDKIGNVSIACSINSFSSSVAPLRRDNSFSSSEESSLSHPGGSLSVRNIRKHSNENEKNFCGATTHLKTHNYKAAATNSETIKITSKHETHTCNNSARCDCVQSEPYTSNNLIKAASSCSSNALLNTSRGAMISVGKLKSTSEITPDEGYLVSESIFCSSSEGEEEEEGDEENRPSVQRSYDVAGAASHPENIVESSSSSNDESGSDASDDSEDTGIDDRRTKAKKFSRVFVVNKHSNHNSETDSNHMETSTSGEDVETSDNDTDTDGITLNYMKPFAEESSDSGPEETTTQEILLKTIRHIDSDDDGNVVILSSIKPIDNDFIANVDQSHTTTTTTIAALDDEKENACVIDDKNNHYSPSIQNNNNNDDVRSVIDESIKDESNESVSHVDSLESSTHEIATKHSTDGDRNRMDLMEINGPRGRTERVQSCNLSMIFGSSDSVNDNKREREQTEDDVKTGSDENLLKIESPLNSTIFMLQQQYMHDQHDTAKAKAAESNSQTLPSVEIVNNDNVPITSTLAQTSLMLLQHSHTQRSSDQQQQAESTITTLTASAGNSIPQNNSCVKQMNVNEKEVTTSAALQELLGSENASVSSQRSNSTDVGCSGNNKFTSLIMITQADNEEDINQETMDNSSVSIISNDTTQIITDSRDSVIVQHKNWQPRDLSSGNGSSSGVKSKIGFYEKNINKVKENLNLKVKSATSGDNKSLSSCAIKVPPENYETNKNDDNENNNQDHAVEEEEKDKACDVNDNSVVTVVNDEARENSAGENNSVKSDDVKVITGQKTLSAVICLEDGLADDDSWVEEMSQNDEEEFPSTETGSDFDSSDEMSLSLAMDREEELRGYNRVSIDFTLHTIVEESCEESEYESCDRKSQRISASELEKYFFFGLSGGDVNNQAVNVASSSKEHDESPSETSSVCSEGLDSLNTGESENVNECGALISSRLEKYFLSGFMGFQNDGGNETDGSGSVGSDSEGRPSPEQRRKKLVRARGSGRSHSSSLDNLLAKDESLENEAQTPTLQQESDDSSETTDTCDDNHAEKTENHCDTVKRKKKSKKHDSLIVSASAVMVDEDEVSTKKSLEIEVKNATDSDESDNDNEEESGRKTPQPEFLMPSNNNLVQSRKQHSRDSGFIGSNDDLLKSEGQKSPELKIELAEIQEEMKETEQSPLPANSSSSSSPSQPFTNLMRKDSFNAWSSDEETNLMMSKMRQFFKSLVAANGNSNTKNSRSTTPTTTTINESNIEAPKPAPRQRQRPPQLVYFENELTRLMKTVPGVTESQVKELVEYLSSEDTWSDSYDSSDYTSSDKESAGKNKSIKIQQQISASCQEIIEKFDTRTHQQSSHNNHHNVKHDEEGDMGDGGVLEDGINKETAFVYQKLVASISKIADEKPPSDITNSPPIISKVMHHIGTRLVALMHEVSSGESLKSNSPRQPRQHRRIQAKISATTTEDDDSTSESNMDENLMNNLPRSKSHDLLLDGKHPSAHDHMTSEEREASDYERFSWRGSFESALLTNCDSRNKLSTLENSTSALSILAAKRRSAGDLLFTPNNLSREQLDRVRSCGSIGGDHDLENSKLWESTQSQESSRKRVPGILEDDTDESSDNDQHRQRSTLPRSLQISTITASTTNSLPRLPTSSSNSTSSAPPTSGAIQKFLHNNVKSARYRAPGFTRTQQTPKRALSAPGLQPFLARRERRKVHSHTMEEQTTNSSSEKVGSPTAGSKKDGGIAKPTTDPWPSSQGGDEDIDRLVAMHQNRHNSLSSLGLRSDSMASVYSGAGEGRYGTVQVKGMVEFGMQYNYKQCALEIHVKQCKELAAVDTKRNRSDPYVKVYLLPDKTKSGKRKTKVKKHTLNPVFDEVLRFYMSLSSLESRTLWLTVWHSDMFGRNDFLGEVMISLQNKVFDNPQPQWYPLEERSEPFEDVTTYRGDIIVGLKFVPDSSSGSSYSHGLSLRKFSIKSNSSANSNNGSSGGGGGGGVTSSCSKNTKGSLHVLVKEAKHLSPVKANGHCDAFCKSYLLPDKNRSSKQKTTVIKRTTNPQWNYTFVYDDVTLADLSERALELTIWDHDRLASNEFLGGVRFSLGTGKHYGRSVDWNDANGKELTLYQSMINRPNFWVEGCLCLRSSLDRTAP